MDDKTTSASLRLSRTSLTHLFGTAKRREEKLLQAIVEARGGKLVCNFVLLQQLDEVAAEPSDSLTSPKEANARILDQALDTRW